MRGASKRCNGTRIRMAAVRLQHCACSTLHMQHTARAAHCACITLRLQHTAPAAQNATGPLQHPPITEDAAKKFREVTDAYKLLSRGEDACKGYEELAAENEKVREALSRTMEMAQKLAAASSSEPSPSDPKHTVMQVGAATWVGEVEGGRPHGSGDLILPNGVPCATPRLSPSPGPGPNPSPSPSPSSNQVRCTTASSRRVVLAVPACCTRRWAR